MTEFLEERCPVSSYLLLLSKHNHHVDYFAAIGGSALRRGEGKRKRKEIKALLLLLGQPTPDTKVSTVRAATASGGSSFHSLIDLGRNGNCLPALVNVATSQFSSDVHLIGQTLVS